MNLVYLPEPVADCRGLHFSVGNPLDMSSGMITVSNLLPPESETESCQTLPSSAISEHSSIKGSPTHIRAWLMSLQPASPANHLAMQGVDMVSMMNEIDGQKHLNAFASYDPDLHYWKTSQACLLHTETSQHTFQKYLGNFPKSGSMRNGMCFQRARSVRHTHVKECSSWPTPTVSDAEGGGSAKEAERYLAGQKRKSGAHINLHVNSLYKLRYGVQPTSAIYEYLMGWAQKWSGLEPLETDRFQSWLRQHGTTYRNEFSSRGLKRRVRKSELQLGFGLE